MLKKLLCRPSAWVIALLRRMRLYPRLVLLTLLCGVLPLAVLTLLVMKNVQQTYIDSTYRNIQQSMELYTALMDERLEKYNTTARKLSSYAGTVRMVSSEPASSIDQYIFIGNYKKYLGDSYLALSRLISVEITSRSGSITATPYYFMKMEEGGQNPCLEKAVASGKSCFWQVINRGDLLQDRSFSMPFIGKYNESLLLLTVPVESATASKTEIGYVNYAVSLQLLADVARNIQAYETFKNNQRFLNNLRIIDAEERVVYSASTEEIGNALEAEQQLLLQQYNRTRDTAQAEGGPGKQPFLLYQPPEQPLFFCVDSQQADFRVVLTVNADVFMADTFRSLRTIGWACAICILFILLTSFVFIASVNRPVARLMRHMRATDEKALLRPLADDGHDEIMELVGNYNEMTQRISKLMEDAVRNEKHLQKAEYDALVTQINPHFLYNTLDMINWMAYRDGAQTISRTITNLSNFFRLSMKANDETYTVEQEIEHVKCYSAIQTERFKEKISFRYEVDSAALQCRMIKIILQPLVENSIIHGILPSGDNGVIQIRVHRKGDLLCMTVTDDGVGLQGKKPMEALEGQPVHSSGYGLFSINRRIQLTFGAQYGLAIFDNEELGATVEVRLPAIDARGGGYLEHPDFG
ncbi:MAG: sensor histidine kinase [Gemmiger sp.]|nr:sensor histidine kinase [Gemmiger sp.]